MVHGARERCAGALLAVGGWGPTDGGQWVVGESRQLSGPSRPIRFNTNVEADFRFRYDQPFRLTARFSANVYPGGDADISAAPSCLLDLPAGTVITSVSGIGCIAAVPEPGTYASLMLGLAGLSPDHGGRARRNGR